MSFDDPTDKAAMYHRAYTSWSIRADAAKESARAGNAGAIPASSTPTPLSPTESAPPSLVGGAGRED